MKTPLTRSSERRSFARTLFTSGGALASASVATLVIGALFTQWGATWWGAASAPLALLSALAAFAAATLAPLAFDYRVTKAHRRSHPNAHATWAQSVIVWNALLLGGCVFLAPRDIHDGLDRGADWVGRSRNDRAAQGAARFAHWLAARLPAGRELGRSAEIPAPGVASAVTALPGSQAQASSSATPAPGTPPSTDAADGAALATAGSRDAAPATTGSQGSPSAEASPAPPLPDHALSTEEIVREHAGAVVIVNVRERADPTSLRASVFGINAATSFGSGFVIDPRGLVVTNEHVIHDADSVEIKLHDGRVLSPVELLVADRAHDLALLRVRAESLDTLALAPEDAPPLGQRAVAIGDPFGMSSSVTEGAINAVRELQGTRFLQMQTPVAPGSSGGPLFDPRGAVIGVVTASYGNGFNLALPASYVRELLDRPRAPRPFAPFVASAKVSEIRYEGDEMNPVDRLRYAEFIELWSQVLEPCWAKAPTASHLAHVETLSPDDAGPWSGSTHANAKKDVTDFGAEGEACVASKTDSPLQRLFALIVRMNNSRTLHEGRPVILLFHLDARGTRADVEGGGAARTIDVRFELRPTPGAGPDESTSPNAPAPSVGKPTRPAPSGSAGKQGTVL